MAKSLRDAIKQRISSDPQSVVRALQSSGVKLTQEETSRITQGRLDQFSDKQLTERFNSKVLGMLGISADSYEDRREGREGKEGKEGRAGQERGQQRQERNPRQDKERGQSGQKWE